MEKSTKRVCKNDRKNVTERKRVRNVRTEYEALESIFSKQKWITGKLSSVEVLKVSYCVICEVLGKKVALSPHSCRDFPPAKKVKIEAPGRSTSGRQDLHNYRNSHHHHQPQLHPRPSLKQYPLPNGAEFPGCLLVKGSLLDSQPTSSSSSSSSSTSEAHHSEENILFCSEEVTYQGESDDEDNAAEDIPLNCRGNRGVTHSDCHGNKGANISTSQVMLSSSPPLTPPTLGGTASHHHSDVIATTPTYGCSLPPLIPDGVPMSSSSTGAVMLSYNSSSGGPWLCSPQINFSPVEATPIHHHHPNPLSCSPLSTSPLSCPVMYSPPFTPNLFEQARLVPGECMARSSSEREL